MKLNYRLQAARHPEQGLPVVLIHGLFGSLDNLGVLARPLGENHRTLQIDLRNHGLVPPRPHHGLRQNGARCAGVTGRAAY